MNKFEKAEKLVNEQLDRLLADERLTTQMRLDFMMGLTYGLSMTKQLAGGDLIAIYLRMQKELGVRILP